MNSSVHWKSQFLPKTHGHVNWSPVEEGTRTGQVVDLGSGGIEIVQEKKNMRTN